MLRGALHVERLVGPLVVVAVDEVIELGLLPQESWPAGLVVSSFKVGCTRSWRPFCCGLPGLIRSISKPSLSKLIANSCCPPGPRAPIGRSLCRQLTSRTNGRNLFATGTTAD